MIRIETRNHYKKHDWSMALIPTIILGEYDKEYYIGVGFLFWEGGIFIDTKHGVR